ncbi:MAG: hypothetical protein ACK5N8_05670 [Alphaproteobacteria bacterium]
MKKRIFATFVLERNENQFLDEFASASDFFDTDKNEMSHSLDHYALRSTEGDVYFFEMCESKIRGTYIGLAINLLSKSFSLMVKKGSLKIYNGNLKIPYEYYQKTHLSEMLIPTVGYNSKTVEFVKDLFGLNFEEKAIENLTMAFSLQ